MDKDLLEKGNYVPGAVLPCGDKVRVIDYIGGLKVSADTTFCRLIEFSTSSSVGPEEVSENGEQEDATSSMWGIIDQNPKTGKLRFKDIGTFLTEQLYGIKDTDYVGKS